ncbi:MAG TPA: hypothetical protein DCM45_07525 [Clostridiales bacterium]|nr:hypothetical protein [Clostridiales bacterium]
MRAYTKEDLARLANDASSVVSYGVPVNVKRSPAGLAEGYLDPWVLESLKTGLEKRVFRKSLKATWTSFEKNNIKVRYWKIEVPDHQTKKPAYVNIHGGGWSAGHATKDSDALRTLAEQAGAVVFDLEYSLSPQARFPAAVEECYAALKHIYTNSENLGIDATRITVGGGSAGGNLAAVMALLARDEKIPMIASQVLLVPVLLLQQNGYPEFFIDDVCFKIASEKETCFHRPPNPANEPTDSEMIANYLENLSQADDFRASPILARDFRGLPPALIITAEFDRMRPHGEFYASQLASAGVPVRVVRYQGLLPDSIAKFGIVPQAEDKTCEIIKLIRNGL